jgi:hypothetical protein
MQILMQLHYVIRDHTIIVCDVVGEATASAIQQPQLCDADRNLKAWLPQGNSISNRSYMLKIRIRNDN